MQNGEENKETGSFFSPSFIQFPQYTTSMWVISCVAAIMAMDFMIVYISIFDYWVTQLTHFPDTPLPPSTPGPPMAPSAAPSHSQHYWTGRNLQSMVDTQPVNVDYDTYSDAASEAKHAAKTYGFAFGCYDLAQMVLIPVVAWAADTLGYKPLLCFTVVMNLAGNVLYACAIIPKSRAMFLAGRILAGLGSGNLVLFQSFMVIISTRTGRSAAMERYRSISFFGRFAGPFAGWALMYIPSPKDAVGWTPLLLANFTLPAWVMALCDVFLLVAILALFKDPLRDPAVREIKMGEADNVGVIQYLKTHTQLLQNIGRSQCVWLGGICAFWLIYAQVVPLYMLNFHKGATDAAVAYTAVGIGFVAGLVLMRRLRKMNVDDMNVLMLGLLLMIIGCFLANNWWPIKPVTAGGLGVVGTVHDENQIPKGHVILYEVGIGVICAGFNLFSTTSVAIYSLVVEGAPYMTSLMAISVMIGSGARFAGPTVSSFLIGIHCEPGKHVSMKDKLAHCSPEHELALFMTSVGFAAFALLGAFLLLRPLYAQKIEEVDAEREPLQVQA